MKEKEEEEKNKNKGRGIRADDDADDNSNPISPLLDDHGDILLEILSRLPMKSLMQFKSVCKHWRSLIEEDRYFIDLHLTQSQTRPRIFFIIPLKKDWRRLLYHIGIKSSGRKERFLSADLFEGRVSARAAIHNIKKTGYSGSYDKILKPVNGLICFILSKAYAIRICNVSTRQVTPWIKSILPTKLHQEEEQQQEEEQAQDQEEEEEEEGVWEEYGIEVHGYPSYHFGFDPATKEHKVIGIWRISGSQTLGGRKFKDRYHVVCEVLTVGEDNTWKRIDEVPPYDPKGDSIYVNGSLYWNNKHINDEWDKTYDDDDYDYYPKFIVAFDVGSEKFKVISIPNFILNDQPLSEQQYYGEFEAAGLFELDGCLALSYRMSDYIVKFWIFDDDKKENRATTTTTIASNRRNWIEETITLPFRWERNQILYIHGVAGTDKIIFEFYTDFHRHMNCVSLYSYSRKQKTFSVVEINRVPSFRNHYSRSLCTTFVESLLPVQKQKQNQKQHRPRHAVQPPHEKCITI